VLDAICDCNLCQHNLEPVSATALPARTSDQKTHNYKASTPSSIAGLLVTKGVLYTFRLLSHQLSEASMTSGALSLSPSLKHYHLLYPRLHNSLSSARLPAANCRMNLRGLHNSKARDLVNLEKRTGMPLSAPR